MSNTKGLSTPARDVRWLHHRRYVRAAILAVVVLVAFTASASAKVYVCYAPHEGVVEVVDTEAPGYRAKPLSAKADVRVFNGITWTITYLDIDTNTNIGFDHPAYGAQRRARLEDALDYVSSVLNETGSLELEVQVSETDGGGFLASGGAWYSGSPAFTAGAAFDHIQTGSDPFPANEDIMMTVDFGYNWYEGTGDPGLTEVDLISVLIHELTHGLGFSSLSTSTGGSQIAANVYSTWDELLELGSVVVDLFDYVTGAPTFIGAAADLISDDIIFTGTAATSAYGSEPPAYAPTTFAPGSSLSHFDDDLTAVMGPVIFTGDMLRTYSDFEIGALRDIGWGNSASGPAVWVDFDDVSAPWEGTEDAPYNTLAEAITGVEEGGTIFALAGTTSETPTITKTLRIEAVGGSVWIGVP